MTRWADIARRTIGEVDATIPAVTTLKERMALIDAAYPFGERAMWPYKAWLKARKAYLARYRQGPPLELIADGLFGHDAAPKNSGRTT